jgi:hypothetical protein
LWARRRKAAGLGDLDGDEAEARTPEAAQDGGGGGTSCCSRLATILREHRKELLAAGCNVAERGVGKAGDRAGLNPEPLRDLLAVGSPRAVLMVS